MNTSGMFSLNLGDFVRGLVLAIFAGVFLPVLAVLQTPGFDFTHIDWHTVEILAINGGLAGLAAYLTKNFFSTSDNKFVGKIG